MSRWTSSARSADLDGADELHAWVVSSLLINDEIFGFDPIGAALLDRGEEFRSRHHRPDFVKIFLDGVPPAHTAAFSTPNPADAAHGAHFHGETTMSLDELTGWLRAVAERGLGAKVHCTGDGSARLVLDAAQRLRSEGFTTPVQIAHGQFLADSDIPRLAALNVSADISPFIWYPGVIPQALADVLGDRAEHSQPNRALLDAGALVAGGSDWPVSESPNTLEGLQGLVTRADPLGQRSGNALAGTGHHGRGALEVSRSTRRPRWARRRDRLPRPREVRRRSVVLARDAIAGPADEIVRTPVVSTWFRRPPRARRLIGDAAPRRYDEAMRRFPSSVYSVGEEPDPAILARQRAVRSCLTRTALALIAGGVASRCSVWICIRASALRRRCC